MNAMQSESDANKSFGDIISEVKIIKQQVNEKKNFFFIKFNNFF